MSDAAKPARPKSRLGRGLSSLISVSEAAPAEHLAEPVRREIGGGAGDEAVAPAGAAGGAAGTTPPPPGVRVVELPLAHIVPNPHQPRRQFDEAGLAELASSLKATGVIQPIIVRPSGQGGEQYELIAGERRWRAAKLAELETVPALVRDVDGATQAQMALIENVQREDLNPLDRALAYQALLQHLGLTQAELAGRLGEDRSTITNFVRLLELPEPVQGYVRDGKLSLGHAKLLAGVADGAEQQRLADLVVSQSLSVRNLERLIQAPASTTPPTKASPLKHSAHLQDLERLMSRQLSMRVQVRSSPRKGHGRLILHFTSLDQFDDLMGRLGVKTE